jgi:hypothetical protein
MTLLRRFLTIAALMVWQGGFIFYTAVVVPIGTSVLESSTRQGFITQRVTATMNVCGVVALTLIALDLASSHAAVNRLFMSRVCLFLLMAAAAVALFLLHARLDALLDVSNERVVDRNTFRPMHRMYLWISSAQWGCAAGYLVLLLAAWRNHDRQKRIGAEPS